jgi:hypothetical protein
VGKAQLPRDVRGVDLDYDRLISTLESVIGEPVVVRFSTRDAERDGSMNVASIVGELGQHVPARYEDHEFSIGTPYAECYPEHLAGGILFLKKESFRSAKLTTFDGNDYFILGIETHSGHILVQSSDSTGP